MVSFLDPLREMSFVSILLRLILAMFTGGLIGLERGRKGRAAGFRTYMLVSVGAALTFMIAQYNTELIQHSFSDLITTIGLKTDVSRFSAQVINGIGFLGAGTIIVTGKQQVKGLTTAAGLWASGCVGIAVGAGFYECVIVTFILIFICMKLFEPLEDRIVENAKYINIYVEFKSLDDVGTIINCLRGLNAQILDVDITRGREKKSIKPSAIFSIRLNERKPHAEIIAAISSLDRVITIDEI